MTTSSQSGSNAARIRANADEVIAQRLRSSVKLRIIFRFDCGEFMKIALLLLLVALSHRTAAAQSTADAINVFLDCDDCDHDFVRTEITFVNWMRERTVADVHILVSDQDTGGGGERYTLNFVGLRRFLSREDTLVFATTRDDSPDQVRRTINQAIRVGLVPFVASTNAGLKNLQVNWSAATDTASKTTPADDPWKAWVFSLGLRSNFNGEESQRFLNWNTEVEARRITAEQKIELELNSSFNRSGFDITESDGSTREIKATQEYYNAEALAVRSLGPHWSVGAQSEATQATFANINLGFNFGPAIEYSYWPYAEATRRSLVLRYSAGVRSHRYEQRTIYGKIEETHPAHSLTGEIGMKQRWGSLNFEARYSQFLHNTDFNNLFTFGRADLRLVKGFSVNFYASYSRVRDQISLPQEELTPEEVLLRQKELSTGFRYFGGVGVRYSFGSIFNNVVNPRFGGS